MGRSPELPKPTYRAARPAEGSLMDDVPIQYFQSVIAIELGVTGALLFQIRFFAPRGSQQGDRQLPDARLRLALAWSSAPPSSVHWGRCSMEATGARRPP